MGIRISNPGPILVMQRGLLIDGDTPHGRTVPDIAPHRKTPATITPTIPDEQVLTQETERKQKQ